MKDYSNDVVSDLIKKEIKSVDLAMKLYAWVVLPLMVAGGVAVIVCNL